MDRIELHDSKLINAPAARVWDALTDADIHERILTDVVRIEALEGEKGQVGFRWRETRKVNGQQGTGEIRIVAVDPGRSISSVGTVNGLTTRGTYTLTERGGRTELSVSAVTDPKDAPWWPRLVMALFGRHVIKQTKESARRELDDVAAYCEDSRQPAAD
jgi:uncharacterized protein YndB with AHSA1/START domain